jgi:hypothetical protein
MYLTIITFNIMVYTTINTPYMSMFWAFQIATFYRILNPTHMFRKSNPITLFIHEQYVCWRHSVYIGYRIHSCTLSIVCDGHVLVYHGPYHIAQYQLWMCNSILCWEHHIGMSMYFSNVIGVYICGKIPDLDVKCKNRK